MKLNKLSLSLFLILFSVMAINAQDARETAFLETTSSFSNSSTIIFNPNGIGMSIENNTLSLFFQNRIPNLICEVINKKGKILLRKKAKSTQQSSLDISSLKKGTYYIRIYDGPLKDFLKFSKK